MKNQIKQLKDRLDCYIHLTKELKPLKENKTINAVEFISLEYFKYNSKEIEKVVDSMMIARFWVDKYLAQIGENAKTTVNFEGEEVVVGTKFIMDLGYWNSLMYSEKIMWLITEIDKCINFDISMFIYQYLSEASFWLNMEADRDYESQKGPKVE